MQVDAVATTWSYCYHVTFELNIPSIKERGVLLPAAQLFDSAGRPDLFTLRRMNDVVLQIRGREVIVRNQSPLDPTRMELDAGASLDEYITCLNLRSYFWPGTTGGPTADGWRMFGRVDEICRPAIIRVPTNSLLQSLDCLVMVSTCNAGAAWTDNGVKSVRGPSIFEPLGQYARTAGEIAEISFVGPILLPRDACYSDSPDGPWQPLLTT